MSVQKLREMTFPDGNTVSVTEVDFEIVREGWSEYNLSDGTRLRTKNVIMRVFLQVDEDGNIVYNEVGEPNVIITGNTILAPVAPEK